MSQAKTTAEIYNGYDSCDYKNYHATQKWVPEADFEALVKVAANKRCLRNESLLREANQLKKKITDANKILDEWGCGDCTPAVLLREALK
jgi:hypothetical protein